MTATPVGYFFYGEHYADLAADGGGRVLRAGKPLEHPLFPQEFGVLLFFLQNPQKIVTRDTKVPKLPVLPKGHPGRPLDGCVQKINKKLREGLDGVENVIEPVWGSGYRLNTEVRIKYQHDSQEAVELLKASDMHFRIHTVKALKLSLAQAEEAIKINPTLDDAYVTAAYCELGLCQSAYCAAVPTDAMPIAKSRAMTALDINRNNARALGILGLYSMIYDYDWVQAEKGLKAALTLDPHEPGSLLAYAHLLVASGRSDEALTVIDRAAVADSTDRIVFASWGWIYLFAGKTQKAVELCSKAVNLYPDLAPAHNLLGVAYEAVNDYDNALKHYQESLDLELAPATLAFLGHLYGKTGDHKSASGVLNKLTELHKEGILSYLPGYCLALVNAGMGNRDKCLAELERAYSQHCDWLIHLSVDPRWAPLRKIKEFRALVKKVGIPLAQSPHRKEF
jgi:tetratricopeptide (TPR) repeat protein